MNVQKLLGKVACAMSVGVMAPMAYADAGYAVVDAPASLTALGFLPQSYLLNAGGEVAELLEGDCNVQVNDQAKGGAVVTLANATNTFSGGIHVASGTLAVPTTLAVLNQPSALGSGVAPIVLGPGTLRFTGDVETDRDLIFLPDAAAGKAASIVRVDDGATARVDGRVMMADGKKGNFIKDGAGTLVVATRWADGENTFGRAGNAPGWTNANAPAPTFPANGDGPTSYFEAFNIRNGRMVIATGDTVTNRFPSEAWIGFNSTDVAGAETAGHLDIYSGVSIFDVSIAVGRHNGTTTTAPDGLSSSLNLYGGEVFCASLNCGYGEDEKFTQRPEVNVHGGKLTITATGASPSDYAMRTDHNWSYCKMTVDGGEVVVNGRVRNQHYGTGGAQLHLDVSGEGKFTCSSVFFASRASTAARKTVCRLSVHDGGTFKANEYYASANSDCRVDVTDGGTFIVKTANTASSAEMHVDGGTFKSTQYDYGNGVNFGAVYVGAKGMKIDVTGTRAWGPLWTAPIKPEPGVTDGGIDIEGKYAASAHFPDSHIRFGTDDITITGGIRLKDAGMMIAAGDYNTTFTLNDHASIRAYGDAAVDGLAYTGNVGYMSLAVNGGGTAVTNIAKLTARAFTPPSGPIMVSWRGGDSTSVLPAYGTFDVFTFPASVDYGAKDFLFVYNSADHAFKFTERVENGWRTIVLTVSPDAGSVSAGDPWSLGPWLSVYEGGTATSSDPVTLVQAANQLAGLAVPEGVSLTLTGGLSSILGGFAKMGTGTLTLGGNSAYSFSTAFTTTASLGNTLQNLALFDGVTNGAPNLVTHNAVVTVGRGTLSIGTGEDAPTVALPTGSIHVGTDTTSDAGAEGDAALVVNSGALTTANGSLYVGYDHGTAATREKDTLVSSYTQNGGTVDVGSVYVGYDNSLAAQMDSRFTLNAGDFNCRGIFALGYPYKALTLPTTVTFAQTGGRLSVGETPYRKGSDEGRMLVNYNLNQNLAVTYTMTGGEAMFWKGLSLYNGGTYTLNLDGGRIDFFNTFNGGGNSTLNWNGTVLVPHANAAGTAPTLVNTFTSVKCDTEAIVDVTYCNEIDLRQIPSGTGKVVVRGSNTNNCLRLPNVSFANLAGGLAVEKGGMAIALGNNGNAPSTILVKDGGGICDYYGKTWPNVILGETEDDTVIICGYDMRRALTCFTATALTVNAGTVYVAYRDPIGGGFTIYSGKNTMLKGAKGSIDASKFALHPELAAKGATATFAVNTSNANYDALEVTVTALPRHTWTAAGSGDWSDSANWDSPPDGTVHDVVEFPSTLAADATVSLGYGKHVWEIHQNSASTVTLDGPLTLNGSPSYDIAKTNGVLELAGRVKLGSVSDSRDWTLASSGTSGRGTLRVTGELDNTQRITIDSRSGRIEGRPEAFGTANIKLSNTTLRFTESGVCKADIGNSGSGGLGIDVAEGKTAYLAGKFTNETALVKIGPGTAVIRNSGYTVLGKGGKSAGQEYYAYGNICPFNGDVPNASALAVYAGTLVLAGPDAIYSVPSSSADIFIGGNPFLDENGDPYDVRLVVDEGAQVTFPSDKLFSIGRYLHSGQNGKAYTPKALGLTKRPHYAMDIRNGRVTARGVIVNYNNYTYEGCMVAELNVYPGGELITTTERFAICHDGDDVQLADGESVGVVNLYGGLIDHQSTAQDIKVNYYSSVRTYPARGVINIYGGLFRTLPARGVNLVVGGHAHGSLNLCGGVLETGCITWNDGNAKSKADVHFDGGTYRPLQNAQTLGAKPFTTFTVGEGGAKFDLNAVAELTLGQTLSTADGVAADGGITLASTNSASLLTLGAANAFSGPLTVDGGVMRPAIAAAASCATGVVVNAGGVFDANGIAFTFGYLKGNGGTYTNGTVTVTGEVEPGELGLYVQNLVLAAGATLKSPISGNAGDGWTAPCLSVSGSVSAQGAVTVDVGGTEDAPLRKGSRVKVAEVAGGGSFQAMRGSGVCERNAIIAVRRTVSDGVTEVWAEVVPVPLAVILR